MSNNVNESIDFLFAYETRDRMSKGTVHQLAKRWNNSQELLEVAARLDKNDNLEALNEYKKAYAERRFNRIIREAIDPYD